MSGYDTTLIGNLVSNKSTIGNLYVSTLHEKILGSNIVMGNVVQLNALGDVLDIPINILGINNSGEITLGTSGSLSTPLTSITSLVTGGIAYQVATSGGTMSNSTNFAYDGTTVLITSPLVTPGYNTAPLYITGSLGIGKSLPLCIGFGLSSGEHGTIKYTNVGLAEKAMDLELVTIGNVAASLTLDTNYIWLRRISAGITTASVKLENDISISSTAGSLYVSMSTRKIMFKNPGGLVGAYTIEFPKVAGSNFVLADDETVLAHPYFIFPSLNTALLGDPLRLQSRTFLITDLSAPGGTGNYLMDYSVNTSGTWTIWKPLILMYGYTLPSTRAIKTAFRQLDESDGEILLKSKPFEYEYIHSRGYKQYGFVAEDLTPIGLGNIITYRYYEKNGNEVKLTSNASGLHYQYNDGTIRTIAPGQTDNIEATLTLKEESISYTDLHAMAINLLKIHNTKINNTSTSLTAAEIKIKSSETRITELETKVTNLTARIIELEQVQNDKNSLSGFTIKSNILPKEYEKVAKENIELKRHVNSLENRLQSLERYLNVIKK